MFNKQTRDNIFWSCISGCSIWSAYEVIFLWAYANNYLPYIDFYTNPIWFCLWFVVVLFWREFHFYITHRILHFKPLYKYIHYLHHKNVKVGPWSGLSMHPIEHLIYFSVVLIHCIVPSHPLHFIFNLQHTALSPIQGHSGYDQIELTKNTKVPHSSFFHYLHHKNFECNYGESTIPLDKWFGTFYDGSEESYKKVFESDGEIEAWGDGTPIRDYVYAGDVAEACLISAKKRLHTEIINVGSGVETTIKEMIETTIKISGKDIKINWDTSKPNGEPKRKMNTEKQEDYGLLPKYGFEEGIRKTYEHYKNNINE